MRTLTAAIWFVAAFLAGAGLFLVTRPAPVLQALVDELRGPNLFERCRNVGACAHLEIKPPPVPKQREMPPSDMDRAYQPLSIDRPA